VATKRGRSSGLEAMDVASLMEAFQTVNSCILSVSFEVMTRRGLAELRVIANAYTVNVASAERVLLVSWASSLYALNCQTLEAATIQCLYHLDGLLAAKEMEAPQPK